MRFRSDIDIDFADRSQILSHLKHIKASIHANDTYTPHATGVYFTDIPTDPWTNLASLDYKEAEERGYVKVDLLNVHVYDKVRDEEHLLELMHTEPNWGKLQHKEFFEQLIHINNHYELMQLMPEPVNSIPRMAMFLAIIRPGKRHLTGKTWAEVAKTVWDKPEDDTYYFKKAHAVSYAQLVVVHMNLLSSSSVLE